MMRSRWTFWIGVFGLSGGWLGVAGLGAADWPGFLGPGGLGRGTGEIVTEFGPDTNVRWRVDCPPGHSSPCVAGGRIFVTAAGEGGTELRMLAFNASDGSLAWEREVDGEVEGEFLHKAARPAMSTACSDGKRVVFYFGGYGLTCRDAATGEVVWEKRFPFAPQMFGTGSSPVLAGDVVLLCRDGVDDAALWALDLEDGSVRWKAPRLGLGMSYGSPFVWKNGQRTEVVVAGTNTLRSYALGDGTPLWWVNDLCAFPCTTPVGDEDRCYFAAWTTVNAEGEERARAGIWGDESVSDEELLDPRKMFDRLDRDGDGRIREDELGDSRGRDAFRFVDRNRDGSWDFAEYEPMHTSPAVRGRNLMVAVEAGRDGELAEGAGVLWTHDEGLPYVSSPLVLGERVYLIKSGGLFSCLDAETGEAHFSEERTGVSGEYYASPVSADGRVLLCAERGVVIVYEDGDAMKELARNKVGEKIYATPAIVDGVVYLRTDSGLWAIGH